MNVYYFWQSQPGRGLPSYLELCVETWKRNIAGCNVVRIDHSNMDAYASSFVRAQWLRRFSLPLQSDFMLAAVIFKKGGLFLDIDTIVLPGFDPVQYSADGKLNLYVDEAAGEHSFAFAYASSPGNAILGEYLDRAVPRIRAQSTGAAGLRSLYRNFVRKRPAKVHWSFLGNSLLDPVCNDPAYALDIETRSYADSGFILHGNEYERFWFESGGRSTAVLSGAKDRIFTLQNSWTPVWFKNLSRSQVMKQDCLLSRALRYALEA